MNLSGFKLLRKGWANRLAYLTEIAEGSLLISSPYVTRAGTESLISHLSLQQRTTVELTFLTNLSPAQVCQGSSDPSSFEDLAETFSAIRLIHLPRLHAKTYVADDKIAIITSANMTAGGLYLNYEYGCETSERTAVRAIRKDVQSYAALGAIVTEADLKTYCQLTEEVRSAYKQRLNDARKSTMRRFRRIFQTAEDQLIRLRLTEGALHTVFAKTILYLLRRYGPLSALQIHPMIQGIRPDLCDDLVDRVIDGKRFGKKWKHAVRSAQQHLKRKGDIFLSAGRWHSFRK